MYTIRTDRTHKIEQNTTGMRLFEAPESCFYNFWVHGLKSPLEKHKMLSLNQMNAQTKILEIWKMSQDADHPFRLHVPTQLEECKQTRSKTSGVLPVIGKTDKLKSTFIADGFMAWNQND